MRLTRRVRSRERRVGVEVAGDRTAVAMDVVVRPLCQLQHRNGSGVVHGQQVHVMVCCSGLCSASTRELRCDLQVDSWCWRFVQSCFAVIWSRRGCQSSASSTESVVYGRGRGIVSKHTLLHACTSRRFVLEPKPLLCSVRTVGYAVPSLFACEPQGAALT